MNYATFLMLFFALTSQAQVANRPECKGTSYKIEFPTLGFLYQACHLVPETSAPHYELEYRFRSKTKVDYRLTLDTAAFPDVQPALDQAIAALDFETMNVKITRPLKSRVQEKVIAGDITGAQQEWVRVLLDETEE